MIRAKGDTVPRRVSAEYAAGLVKDGDWVDYGINTAQPDRFDRALAARKDQLRDVRIRRCARAPAWRGGFLAVTILTRTKKKWRARLGSNQRPLASEASTLSTELRAREAL